MKRHFLASVAMTNGVLSFGTPLTIFKSGILMLICHIKANGMKGNPIDLDIQIQLKTFNETYIDGW